MSAGTNRASSVRSRMMSAGRPTSRAPTGRPERLAPAPGGQPQGGGRADDPRVRRRGPGQDGGQAHLVPQVQVVVRRRPVGAQADPDPPGQHARPAGPPRSPASRCCRGSAPRPRRARPSASMSASSSQTAWAASTRPSKHAQRGQQGRRASCRSAPPPPGPRPRSPPGGSAPWPRAVAPPAPPRKARPGAGCRRRGGRSRRAAAPRARPSRRRCGSLGQVGLPRRRRVDAGGVEHARGEHAADARGQGGRGHRAGVQVLLAGGRHPVAQQLVRTERHAPEDVIVVVEGLPGPDRLGEPAVEGQPVARRCAPGSWASGRGSSPGRA